MKRYSQEELSVILAAHKLWIDTRFDDEVKGERADLRRAYLQGADLTGADLQGADLTGADLTGADLTGANLQGADLRQAYLEPIKQDYFSVLSSAPHEAPGVLSALKQGKVDGSTYEGPCACLVGTIANLRDEYFEAMDAIKPDSSRPAERWFLAIREGDTPENNPVSAITVEWTEEWLTAHQSETTTP